MMMERQQRPTIIPYYPPSFSQAPLPPVGRRGIGLTGLSAIRECPVPKWGEGRGGGRGVSQKSFE